MTRWRQGGSCVEGSNASAGERGEGGERERGARLAKRRRRTDLVGEVLTFGGRRDLDPRGAFFRSETDSE